MLKTKTSKDFPLSSDLSFPLMLFCPLLFFPPPSHFLPLSLHKCIWFPGAFSTLATKPRQEAHSICNVSIAPNNNPLLYLHLPPNGSWLSNTLPHNFTPSNLQSSGRLFSLVLQQQQSELRPVLVLILWPSLQVNGCDGESTRIAAAHLVLKRVKKNLEVIKCVFLSWLFVSLHATCISFVCVCVTFARVHERMQCARPWERE